MFVAGFKDPSMPTYYSPSLAHANILYSIYICVCGFALSLSPSLFLGLHNPFTLTGFLQGSTTILPVPPAWAGQGTVLSFSSVQTVPVHRQIFLSALIRGVLERVLLTHPSIAWARVYGSGVILVIKAL